MHSKQKKLEEYKLQLLPEAIEVTMQELNISRDRAVKILTEMTYNMDHQKKKKSNVA